MDGIEYRELYEYAGVFAGSDGNIYRVTDSEIRNGVRYVELAPIKKYICGNYQTVHIMRRNTRELGGQNIGTDSNHR